MALSPCRGCRAGWVSIRSGSRGWGGGKWRGRGDSMDQITSRFQSLMLAFLNNWLVKKWFGGGCLSVRGRLPSLAFNWDGKVILKVRNLVQYIVYNFCRCSPNNPVTHCKNTNPCTYSHREGGGRWTSEKATWALVHDRGRKYQHDWLYLQSINSIKQQ